MTVTLIAIYRRPEDVETFETHYREVHTPLVKAVPGLQRLTLHRPSKHLTGPDAPYLIAEMDYADQAAFDCAMASPENKAAGKDLMSFAQGIVSLMVSEREEVR